MPDVNIQLREVTKDNIRKVVTLKVQPEQSKFVANNTQSLAEAYVYPDRAWPRAVYVGEEPVGFVMLDLVGPDHPDAPDGRASYFLWRLMIADEHQGKGYGRAAVLAVIEHVKTLPDAQSLSVSYVPGEGCPGPFHERMGFVPTGEIEDGEVMMRLTFS